MEWDLAKTLILLGLLDFLKKCSEELGKRSPWQPGRDFLEKGWLGTELWDTIALFCGPRAGQGSSLVCTQHLHWRSGGGQSPLRQNSPSTRVPPFLLARAPGNVSDSWLERLAFSLPAQPMRVQAGQALRFPSWPLLSALHLPDPLSS